jgi:KRAB domain-containing zinc finger protein
MLKLYMDEFVFHFQSAVNCTICDKPFNKENAYKLKYHIKTHSPSVMSKCSICGKEFLTNQGLQKHMAVHTKEKAFKCTYNECGKFFSFQSALILHMRSHKNERKHTCDLCDVNFNLGHHLRNHLKSKIHIDAQRIFDLAE